MYFQQYGLTDGPVLFCIPGLIGGPEDFNDLIPTLGKQFTIVIIDPNEQRRSTEGMNLSLASMEDVSYDSTAERTKDLLFQHFPNRDYYFLGVSLGGKVVYDFATKYPDLFKGGVVTDVGPGPFSESSLFQLVKGIVDNVDLNLPWNEMKKVLQTSIPDKNLRIMVQTQISYPNKNPPAIWKIGMKNFENLLKRQSLNNQEDAFEKVDSSLAKNQHLIHVLHSGRMSGIGPGTYELMKTLKSIKIYELPEATHFLHISHKDLIVELTSKILR